MKKYLQLPALLSLMLSLLITTAQAQLEHISYQIPDRLLNNKPFAKLDTSSYLSTGVLRGKTLGGHLNNPLLPKVTKAKSTCLRSFQVIRA